MKKENSLKQKIYNHCVHILERRINDARIAMQNAQEAANSQDKSSAGDKYETARAMGQLDRDMNAKQLAEARHELDQLLKINIDYVSDKIITGSLIDTNNGSYFIAAGIGAIEILIDSNNEKIKVIMLSPKAPLALAMLGKKTDEQFWFNGKEFIIQQLG